MFLQTELKAEKTENGQLYGSSNSINNNLFNYDKITWLWMTK